MTVAEWRATREDSEEPCRLRRILEALGEWGSARAWIGADPYEGLNTTISPLLRHSKPARQIAIQAYRRLPVPPPWPLHAASRPNAKVSGLVISAYSFPAGQELPGAARWVTALARRLEALRLHHSEAWGYHFDVQTRHLYYPASWPNAIATCFAIRGLLDAYDWGVLPDGPERASRARPFLESLFRESEHGPFFAYVSAGSELIHNANVMVCGTLTRLLSHQPDPRLERRLDAALETTIRLRGSDGNWPYGERSDLSWRDSFHTAYILEGLARVHERTGKHAWLLDSALQTWLDHFFSPSGDARYHPHRAYPIDTHSAASAIDALCIVADARAQTRPRLIELATRIASRTVELLWIERRRSFGNQVNRRWTNTREFMRWTNAPMFEALARLLSQGSALR